MLHLFPQMANTAQERSLASKLLILDPQPAQPSQAHLAVRRTGQGESCTVGFPWKGTLQFRAEASCCSNSVAVDISLRAKGFGAGEVRGSGPEHAEPQESQTGCVSLTI